MIANILKQFLNAKLLFVCLVGLVACSQPVKFGEDPAYSKLVWPEGGAGPRIKYVGHFSSPEEFGISKGFFQLVVDFFTGEENQRLIRPMALVAPSPDKVYVADPGARGVHYFNARENDYRLIQLAGKRPLPSPVGLAIGPNKQVYVTDSELGGVYAITPDSDIAKPLPLQYSLKQPTGIAYDKNRKRLYIVDTETHTLNIYNSYGKRLKRIGKRGNGKLEFNYPTMLSMDQQGHLLVTDSLNFRIQRLSRTGKYISQFGKIGGATGKMTRPKGVASDNLGHIYIVDSLFHALQIFDKKGRLLLHLGQQGQKPGEFWLPTGIYVGDNNTIYIADSHNQRIQVFRYIGGGQ